MNPDTQIKQPPSKYCNTPRIPRIKEQWLSPRHPHKPNPVQTTCGTSCQLRLQEGGTLEKSSSLRTLTSVNSTLTTSLENTKKDSSSALINNQSDPPPHTPPSSLTHRVHQESWSIDPPHPPITRAILEAMVLTRRSHINLPVKTAPKKEIISNTTSQNPHSLLIKKPE